MQLFLVLYIFWYIPYPVVYVVHTHSLLIPKYLVFGSWDWLNRLNTGSLTFVTTPLKTTCCMVMEWCMLLEGLFGRTENSRRLSVLVRKIERVKFLRSSLPSAFHWSKMYQNNFLRSFLPNCGSLIFSFRSVKMLCYRVGEVTHDLILTEKQKGKKNLKAELLREKEKATIYYQDMPENMWKEKNIAKARVLLPRYTKAEKKKIRRKVFFRV